MNISFALTTRQFRERTKTVTRRLGWKNAKPGQILVACEKCQGLKKDQHPVVMGKIRIISVRREPLDVLTDRNYSISYSATAAAQECIMEGFPEMSPEEFVRMFCEHNGCDEFAWVTRIEFEYL